LLNLQRAWKSTTTKATPLPDVWKDLKEKQIRFRRGQVCMVAAAPNAGKSMFALIYAIKADVPTLFFSAGVDCLRGCPSLINSCACSNTVPSITEAKICGIN